MRDARNFNKIETRAVIKLLFLQGRAPKEIHAILTETLACFLPGQAKDLSAPLCNVTLMPLRVYCVNNFTKKPEHVAGIVNKDCLLINLFNGLKKRI